MYLFRPVDSGGQTVDFTCRRPRDRQAAKIFLRRALINPDNRPPKRFLPGWAAQLTLARVTAAPRWACNPSITTYRSHSSVAITTIGVFWKGWIGLTAIRISSVG